MSNIDVNQIKISTINIKSAIDYIKNDKGIVKKILIYFGIILLSIIPILNIFTLCAISGYFVYNSHLRIYDKNKQLSDWKNFEDFIVIGLKYLLAIFAYFFIFFAVFLFFGLITGITVAILKTVNILNLGNISNIVFNMLNLCIDLCITILLTAANLQYTKDLKLSSFFNFKEMKNFITQNPVYFLKYLLILFLLNIVFCVVSTIIAITIVGLLLLPALLFCYFAIISDINAQFIRNTYKIGLDLE